MAHLRSGFAALAAALASATASEASVFVVNSTAVDGGGNPNACNRIERTDTPGDLSTLNTCTLRDAVAAANFFDGDDEIVFNLAGEQTITLLTPLPINQPLDLNAAVLAGWTGQAAALTQLVIRGPSADPLINIASGQTLDVLGQGGASNTTIEDDIGGLGGLSKGGTGILLLTGTNNFGGPINIANGTLRGDTGSIPGGSLMTPRAITDSGTLSFDQDNSDAPDFFGQISGNGKLEKLGTGTLFLRSTNTFTGGTTISAGILKGFVAGTGSSLIGDIVNNATLIFEQGANDGTFGDDISGTGSVVKRGVGDLALKGNNTFTGPLTISAGIVIGNGDSIPGNVVIDLVDGAQLVLDQDADTSSTLDGVISGGSGAQAGLVKLGAGALTLTGNNSFAGGVEIQAGDLIVDTDSLPVTTTDALPEVLLGGGTARLIFDQSQSATFAGVIDGTGALVKRGGGALSLTRTQPFTGDTTIAAGTLIVGVEGQGDGAAASLPGDVLVQNTAALGGIGSVAGAVEVDAGGRVSPGGDDDAGTLSVGSIVFETGSTLSLDVDDTESDLLDVSGAATFQTGVGLDLNVGGLDRGTLFETDLVTSGGLTGLPLLNQTTFLFFTPSLDAVGNAVHLTLTPNGATLPEFAETPNQAAVGQALEDAFAADPGDSDIDEVFDVIGGIDPEDAPQALDDMAGEQLTEFATARLAIADRFQTSLQERIRGVAWSDAEGLISQQDPSLTPVIAGDPVIGRMLPGIAQGGGPWPVAMAGQSMSSILDSADSFGPAPGELGLGGWIDGYGLFGTLDGDSGSKDLDYLIGGFSLGVDYRLHPNWIVGAAGGYAHTELDFDELSGDQSAETGQGALYAGYVMPWLQIGASGRFGYSAMSASRDIDFIGRNTDADFDGWDAGVRGEAALDLFEVRGVEIQPLAAISYTHVQQDEIDESGADSLDLTTDEEEVDSVVSGLGARVHGVIRIDTDLWLHPELRARWNHEFGDTDRQITARIGGEPGAVFSVDGAEVPADSGVFGVGWTLVSAGRLHAFIDYDVTLASELLQHGVAVGAKFVW